MNLTKLNRRIVRETDVPQQLLGCALSVTSLLA